MMRRPQSSPLFPYTTLFRSQKDRHKHIAAVEEAQLRKLGEVCHRTQVSGEVRPRAEPAHVAPQEPVVVGGMDILFLVGIAMVVDRKSTRLNSSHSQISYAVF